MVVRAHSIERKPSSRECNREDADSLILKFASQESSGPNSCNPKDDRNINFELIHVHSETNGEATYDWVKNLDEMLTLGPLQRAKGNGLINPRDPGSKGIASERKPVSPHDYVGGRKEDDDGRDAGDK